MGPRRRGGLSFWALVVITVLGTMVMQAGPGVAKSFRGEVSQYDYLSYEVDVDTLHQRLTFSCNVHLEILVYDPDGKEIEVNGSSGSEMDFVPARKGKYTILLLSDLYPEHVQGECNFDMRETSTTFKTTIKDGQWLDYEIEVEDNNRPVSVHLEWGGTYDRIYPVLLDPSGTEVHPRMDGSVNHSCYIYPARAEGTYKLSIEGSRIMLPEGRRFEASCNYPISGPGLPMTIMGMTLTTIFMLVLLAVLVAVSLAVLRWRMRRRRERASQWRPVTDISDFEQPSRATLPPQRDYSYLSVHAKRRRQGRPPPEPPPRRERIDRYAPETVILQPTPRPPPDLPAVQGMDGYTLPPPPSEVPAPPPAPPPGPAPMAQATGPPRVPTPKPTALQTPPPVQRAAPPRPSPSLQAGPPMERPDLPATAGPAPAPTAPPDPPVPPVPPDPPMRWPRCARCGNILMANHPVCSRCGAPR